jgi:hypothetical protein
MSKKIEITAEQLASLDLLISQKQARIKPIDIIGGVNYALVNLIVTASAVLAVGGCQIKMDAAVKKQLIEMAGNIKLEDLIELRNNTVLRK